MTPQEQASNKGLSRRLDAKELANDPVVQEVLARLQIPAGRITEQLQSDEDIKQRKEIEALVSEVKSCREANSKLSVAELEIAQQEAFRRMNESTDAKERCLLEMEFSCIDQMLAENRTTSCAALPHPSQVPSEESQTPLLVSPNSAIISPTSWFDGEHEEEQVELCHTHDAKANSWRQSIVSVQQTGLYLYDIGQLRQQISLANANVEIATTSHASSALKTLQRQFPKQTFFLFQLRVPSLNNAKFLLVARSEGERRSWMETLSFASTFERIMAGNKEHTSEPLDISKYVHAEAEKGCLIQGFLFKRSAAAGALLGVSPRWKRRFCRVMFDQVHKECTLQYYTATHAHTFISFADLAMVKESPADFFKTLPQIANENPVRIICLQRNNQGSPKKNRKVESCETLLFLEEKFQGFLSWFPNHFNTLFLTNKLEESGEPVQGEVNFPRGSELSQDKTQRSSAFDVHSEVKHSDPACIEENAQTHNLSCEKSVSYRRFQPEEIARDAKSQLHSKIVDHGHKDAWGSISNFEDGRDYCAQSDTEEEDDYLGEQSERRRNDTDPSESGPSDGEEEYSDASTFETPFISQQDFAGNDECDDEQSSKSQTNQLSLASSSASNTNGRDCADVLSQSSQYESASDTSSSPESTKNIGVEKLDTTENTKTDILNSSYNPTSRYRLETIAAGNNSNHLNKHSLDAEIYLGKLERERQRGVSQHRVRAISTSRSRASSTLSVPIVDVSLDSATCKATAVLPQSHSKPQARPHHQPHEELSKPVSGLKQTAPRVKPPGWDAFNLNARKHGFAEPSDQNARVSSYSQFSKSQAKMENLLSEEHAHVSQNYEQLVWNAISKASACLNEGLRDDIDPQVVICSSRLLSMIREAMTQMKANGLPFQHEAAFYTGCKVCIEGTESIQFLSRHNLTQSIPRIHAHVDRTACVNLEQCGPCVLRVARGLCELEKSCTDALLLIMPEEKHTKGSLSSIQSSSVMHVLKNDIDGVSDDDDDDDEHEDDDNDNDEDGDGDDSESTEDDDNNDDEEEDDDKHDEYEEYEEHEKCNVRMTGQYLKTSVEKNASSDKCEPYAEGKDTLTSFGLDNIEHEHIYVSTADHNDVLSAPSSLDYNSDQYSDCESSDMCSQLKPENSVLKSKTANDDQQPLSTIKHIIASSQRSLAMRKLSEHLGEDIFSTQNIITSNPMPQKGLPPRNFGIGILHPLPRRMPPSIPMPTYSKDLSFAQPCQDSLDAKDAKPGEDSFDSNEDPRSKVLIQLGQSKDVLNPISMSVGQTTSFLENGNVSWESSESMDPPTPKIPSNAHVSVDLGTEKQSKLAPKQPKHNSPREQWVMSKSFTQTYWTHRRVLLDRARCLLIVSGPNRTSTNYEEISLPGSTIEYIGQSTIYGPNNELVRIFQLSISSPVNGWWALAFPTNKLAQLWQHQLSTLSVVPMRYNAHSDLPQSTIQQMQYRMNPNLRKLAAGRSYRCATTDSASQRKEFKRFSVDAQMLFGSSSVKNEAHQKNSQHEIDGLHVNQTGHEQIPSKERKNSCLSTGIGVLLETKSDQRNFTCRTGATILSPSLSILSASERKVESHISQRLPKHLEVKRVTSECAQGVKYDKRDHIKVGSVIQDIERILSIMVKGSVWHFVSPSEHFRLIKAKVYLDMSHKLLWVCPINKSEKRVQTIKIVLQDVKKITRGAPSAALLNAAVACCKVSNTTEESACLLRSDADINSADRFLANETVNCCLQVAFGCGIAYSNVEILAQDPSMCTIYAFGLMHLTNFKNDIVK